VNPPTEAARVPVARVVGAHGLRGQLRVHPFHFPAPSLAPGCPLVIEARTGARRATVVSAAPHGRGLLLLAVTGITDRTAAEACRGATLLVARTDLPALAADEFYHHEVVGFAVGTVEGDVLGVVESTLATGLNDVWVVRAPNGREHLIPVIADVVRTIDRAARRIVIDPLPGLLA